LYGITAGDGEYVWVVGDDDIILPGAINTILSINKCGNISELPDLFLFL
jgi:hypothetical protein